MALLSFSETAGAPAIFIDKDGTLIEDVPYNVDPSQIRLSEGAIPALRAWTRHGFRLVVVTNQPGIALGKFSVDALQGVEDHLRSMLSAEGIRLDGFVWCPHAPSASRTPTCTCRKPMPGMITNAARALDIDLSVSWMIGDILDDIEAGRRAGCRTVLINNGHETEWNLGGLRQPHHLARDLESAAWVITGDAELSPTMLREGAAA